MKKVVFVLFVIIMFFSSCKKGKESADKGNVTNVTFWHVMGGPLKKTLDNIVNDFNKQNTDIKIIPISVGSYSALSQKLMASITGKKPPVIAQVYESWTSQFLEVGAIVPIQQYIDDPEIGIDTAEVNDIFPILIYDNTFNGQLATLPFNKSVPAYYYNEEKLHELGYNEFPKTWDSLLILLKKATKDTTGDDYPDVWGTAFSINMWLYECMLVQNGGKIFSDDGTKCLVGSKESIDALRYWVDLIKKHKVAYLTTGFQNQDDFLTGRVLTVSGSIVSLPFMFIANPSFTLRINPIPHGKTEKVIVSGTNIAIFNDVSEGKKKAAWKFIKYFMSSEVQAIWSNGTNYLPIRRSSFKDSIMVEKFKKFPGLYETFMQIENADIEPKSPSWFIGRTILNRNGLEPAMRGNVDPDKSLKEAEFLINEEIKKD